MYLTARGKSEQSPKPCVFVVVLAILKKLAPKFLIEPTLGAKQKWASVEDLQRTLKIQSRVKTS